MALLEIKNLKFNYPLSSNSILENLNLTIEKGELVVLIGKSGSGKSTLLKLLKKEIAPYGTLSGEINLDCENIGFVNQNVESNIVTDTVRGELAFPLQYDGKNRFQIELKIAEISNYFNLNSYINEKIENLSGGLKQILSLASVMTTKPEFLVLDEPTSQLDPVSSENFINTVLKLNKEQGITVIISEHEIGNILPFADKIIVLENKKIAFSGTPKETAKYLIDSDSNLKETLPFYVFANKDIEISFAKAKMLCKNIKVKKEVLESEKEKKKKKKDLALSAKGISFAYKKGLNDVFYSLDYKAEKGKISAIVGANGSGKTTLLKCFADIYKCYSGKIKKCGKTAYLPQNPQTLFLKDTVFEEMPNEEVLKEFNLYNLKDNNPFDLSGGEAQRLALSKVLSLNPDILLLDEPTKSLDVIFKKELYKILRKIANSGKTIIFVTHDLEFAGRYADEVSFLFDGKIINTSNRYNFFSSLNIYTTSLSRLTNGKIVSIDDIEVEN